MTRPTALVAAATAMPCVVLAIVSGWWFAAGLAGGGLWPPDDVTLAEAVATRNTAEALRLIEHGADLNAPSRVRAGLLTSNYDVSVTPLEAAVGAKRADVLRMLLANGATVDAARLQVLLCYERERSDSGVRELLEARAGNVHPDCTGVRLPTDRDTR